MQLRPGIIIEKMYNQEETSTQAKLSAKSGISRGTLSVVLRTGSCRYDTAVKIAKALGCELREITDMSKSTLF